MNPLLQSTLSKYTTIVLVGGGTGWHIQPIVSLTRHIKNTNNTPDFIWIGWSDSGEMRVAKEENIRFISIPTLKLATTRSLNVVLYPLFLIIGFYKSWLILKWIQDKNLCIFSKGWPGSVAIWLAAWSLSIPLYIHESDTIPGRSNRILGELATKIFLGFENTKQYFNSSKCEVIGQILDPVFGWEMQGIEYRVQWKTTKPHILVICGSQWSQVIFQTIIDQFSNKNKYEWIIALGKLNSSMQSEFHTIADCQAIEWISQSEISHLIQSTNIAITRGSATTLAELTALEHGPHLIIIPLPYSAGNHQYSNALEYQKIGHTILEQQNLFQLSEIITENA